ncbi:unnamed protein product [Discula destructiva]
MADISSLISQPNNSGNESMAPNPIDTQQLQQQEQQASVKEEEEDADRDVSMLDGSNDKKGKKATDSLNAQPQALAGASRTASVAPPPAAAAATALPTEVPDNGDPIRVFINKRLSPHLMEGMKVVVRNRPEDPLRVLGTYLLTCADKYEPKPQDATNAGSAARVDDNNPTIANDDDDDEDMEE